MPFDFMQLFNPCILFFMAFSFILNGLIAFLWYKKAYLKLGLKKYQSIQRIHLFETPRLGGFVILASLMGYALFCGANEGASILKLMLVAIIPIAIFGIKEDLYYNVKPINRFISLLFSSLLFLWLYRGFLPQLNELPLVKYLVFFQVGNIFFYVLCAAGIANGMNLLDGVNGLCAAVALSILGALLFLSYKTNDTVILELVFSIILVIIPFLFINYPYGRIFLGDLGAYSLGLILSMLTIILFGRHPELSPWGAALILIYPTIEALFSLSRRAIKGISIYQPDSAHLHLKIFHFFRYRPHYKKIANALVTPVLSGLWLFPLLAITWIYQKPLFILIAIILFIAFYGLLYAVVPNTQKNS